MEFHYKLNKERLIFCCDTNEINIITYKEVKDYVLKIILNREIKHIQDLLHN